MRTVTVLVCGNPMRGDDGLALRVVESLPDTTRHLADVRHVVGLAPDDLLGEGPIVIVDAVAGPMPGEIVDLPLDALRRLDWQAAPRSSHALPLTTALAVAERLRGAPVSGRFLGIAGAQFTLGQTLSSAAEASVPHCAARLGHWIRVLAHGPGLRMRGVPSCA